MDQQTPLLATKLTIPAPRSTIVNRPRLTSRLSQESRYRLGLVVAPAGWGKSSVLSAWCAEAHAKPGSVAWVSLDGGDNDPTRFLQYVTAALDRVEPGLAASARAMLQASRTAPIEPALTCLLNEVQGLNRPISLALDDYHTIEAPPVHEAVSFLLDNMPPSLNVVIASRVDPPLPLSRLRVRGQLVELRASDLRFTVEEATAFLNEVMGLNLQPEAVAHLEAKTEGWIAGLQLAAISLQGRADSDEFLNTFTGSNRYIVDYLFDEVLAGQTESTHKFLLQTSVLGRLSASLCDAVTGQPGSQAVLERLDFSNLFMIPLDSERKWYRYHHLFADVLQARLQHEDPALVPVLHKRAADWFEERDMAEDAVSHALTGNLTDQAIGLIERHGQAVWEFGERDTLERWLQAIPKEAISKSPLLCLHQAILHMYDLKILELVQLLDSWMTHDGDDKLQDRDMSGRFLTIRGHMMRITDRHEEALPLTRKALEYLNPDNMAWVSAARLNLGMLLSDAGQLAEARDCLESALGEGRNLRDMHLRFLIHHLLGQISQSEGRLHEAEKNYQSTLDLAAERKALHVPEVYLIHAGLARIALIRNDLQDASKYANWDVPGQAQPLVLETALIERSHVRDAIGDPTAINDIVESVETLARSAGRSQLFMLSAALRLRAARYPKDLAQKWLDEWAEPNVGRRSLPLLTHSIRMLPLITWAECCIAVGRDEEVLPRLKKALEELESQGRFGDALDIRTYLSAFLQQKGNSEEAVAMLEPALALASKEGHVRPFLEAGKSLVPVLRHAVGRGIEAEYAAKLLAAFRDQELIQEKQVAEGESPLDDPLSERELEVLRLVAAGMSNPEIAEHLFLSTGTIKRHVYNIFAKLDVTSRVNAITRARDLGLLS